MSYDFKWDVSCKTETITNKKHKLYAYLGQKIFFFSTIDCLLKFICTWHIWKCSVYSLLADNNRWITGSIFLLVETLQWKKIEIFTWNIISITCITLTWEDMWNNKLRILLTYLHHKITFKYQNYTVTCRKYFTWINNHSGYKLQL